MILIVGLGNPGKKYQATRHNIGWQIVDILAKKENWKKSKKANCLYLKKQINDQPAEIIKPLGFMNNSGKSVKYIQEKHHIKTENIIVIHDDIDFELGKIRISKDRSAAGHKGVQSIIASLGTKDFIRFRIGIGPGRGLLEKFVLKKFSKIEQKIVNQTVELTCEAISFAQKQGLEKTMNKYN